MLVMRILKVRSPPDARLVSGHIVRPSRVIGSPRDSGIGGWRATEQLVGTDGERSGEPGDVIEGEASFAGLEPAEHRDVDAGSIAHLLQREALLLAQFAQASPHSSRGRVG